MASKKYPIYTVSIHWTQWKSSHNERIRNATSWSYMSKTAQDLEIIKQKYTDSFPDLIRSYNEKYEKNNQDDLLIIEPELIDVVVTERFASWNCTWFAHETFDEGQSDKEAWESFEEFVSEMERLYPQDNIPKGGYCLMGAEDRWRWRNGQDEPKPCRCTGCKEAGMIRIIH